MKNLKGCAKVRKNCRELIGGGGAVEPKQRGGGLPSFGVVNLIDIPLGQDIEFS